MFVTQRLEVNKEAYQPLHLASFPSYLNAQPPEVHPLRILGALYNTKLNLPVT
jgi:hypothetical protein